MRKDKDAPAVLVVQVGEWGSVPCSSREFSTGSWGFNGSGKVINPANGEKYQCSFNIVLVNSK
jgi:hypothetical protein